MLRLSLHLHILVHPYFVFARSEGSGESVHMRRIKLPPLVADVISTKLFYALVGINQPTYTALKSSIGRLQVLGLKLRPQTE